MLRRSFTAAVCALAALTLAGTAHAADSKLLRKLKAPPPATLIPLDVGAAKVTLKFARVVVELPPDPWAYYWVLEAGSRPQEGYVSWQEGQKDVDPSSIASIFGEEMRAARVSNEGSGSLFSNESAADLQVGVRIVDMKANLCRGCGGMGAPMRNWHGHVTMSARWEIYSPLERRVVATIETSGGFASPKGGVAGDPDQLVNGAFRDNVRWLVNSDTFRKIATRRPTSSGAPSAPALAPISFALSGGPRAIPEAAKAVVTVFANEGSGSGFLVTGDGYIMTNRHVVGGSKFVKVRWTDGTESLGEVVRSDARRDVAVIKADAHQRQPIGLRRASVLQQGDVVFAIGTPLDAKLQNTVTRGIVSATRDLEGLSYIQSDVAINPGNSGGPLLDEKGLVVAIAVSGIHIGDAPAGLNFFIPIDDALKALGIQAAS
jgi:serine protease Do